MRLLKTRVFILTSVGCVSAATARATSTLPVYETYQSVRSSGMAGASVAVADDESAIFSNPAGIGREDEPGLILRGFSIPNLSLALNAKTYEVFESLESSASGLSEVEKLLSSGENSALFFRGTTFPYITLGRIQLGLLIDAAAQATQVMGTNVPGASWDRSLYAWQRSQAGAVVGFSVPHRDSGLAGGLTARYTIRTSFFSNITESGGTVSRVEIPVNRTKGLALDAGALFESPKRTSWMPIIGFSIRDIGNTLYRGTGKTDSSEIEKSNVMAGATWKLVPGKKSDSQLLFTVEGHHLNDSRVSDTDKIRVGSEFRLAERIAKTPLAFRVGHNMRGVSYGMSVDLLLLRLEAGSLVEGIPTEGGTYLDRRNFVRLSVDLRN